MSKDSVLVGGGAIIAFITGCLIGFRPLVRGENWIEPDWANGALLFAAFLLIAYGAYVLLACK